MKKRVFCGLLCLLLLLGLTGCSDWDETSQFDVLSQYYQSENREFEPELTDFALPYCASESLDPITCSDGFQLTLSGLLYEGLYYLDETWVSHPMLASDCSYDAETFTYTIYLRDNAVFSDGSPITTADVVTSLRRAQAYARYGARFADVDTMDTDNACVVIKMKSDYRLLPDLLDIPIVKMDTESRTVPIGSGPYVIDRDEKGSCLLPNENWWQNKKLPFSRITLTSYNNQSSAVYAFSARDIQLLSSDLTATNALTMTGSGDVIDAGSSTLHFIGFNTNRDLFIEPEFRRALSLAVERESLTDTYLLGHAKPVQFPLSPDSALYPHDLEQAVSPNAFAQAMDALDFCTGENIRTATMIVNEDNGFKVAAAQAVAASMSTCDLRVTVSVLPWEDYLAALLNEEYDLYYGEVRLTADWNFSDLMCAGGALNYSVYSEPELELAMLSYLTSPEDQRSETMHSLCACFQKDMPIIPLCFTNRSLLLSAGAVDGVTPTAANPFYAMENWNVHIKGIT